MIVRINDARTGHEMISAGFTSPALERWDWVRSRVAEEFGCQPEDVGCVDTEERLDNITVRGEIVAYVGGDNE